LEAAYGHEQAVATHERGNGKAISLLENLTKSGGMLMVRDKPLFLGLNLQAACHFPPRGSRGFFWVVFSPMGDFLVFA